MNLQVVEDARTMGCSQRKSAGIEASYHHKEPTYAAVGTMEEKGLIKAVGTSLFISS